MMTEKEMSKAAEQFSKDWANANYERGQAQPFWIALLRKVFGVEDAEQYISFHYCPVKILDLEINRVDHHPLGR